MKASGEKHYRWRGIKASYVAKHQYARKHYRKSECENCGSIKYLQMANVSRRYLRDKLDWKTLCSRCHFYFDKQNERNNFYIKPGSTGQRGVYYHKASGYFYSRIMINNQLIQLGNYKDLDTAAMVRLAAEEELISLKEELANVRV